MRADRLLSLLLLLQQRGLTTAATLAAELEVSERTVHRDVEALSAAGVPVYAERGRHGGFALLAGFRTDLTGMTAAEARALLAPGPGVITSPALASALRKVAASLPAARRAEAVAAAQRVMVTPQGFTRRGDDPPVLADLQEAVFAGRRVRVRYRARGAEPSWRVLDPVGLVHAAGAWYLLALREGAERCYRVARVSGVEVLDAPADRPATVDLDAVWERARAGFRSRLAPVCCVVLVGADRVAGLRAQCEVTDEAPQPDGTVRLHATFLDREHAEHVLWAARATVLEPAELGERFREDARDLLGRSTR